MKDCCKNHQTDSMEMGNLNGVEVSQPQSSACASLPSVTEDDRYPGTFFRVPGVPVPGKTGWSITQ